MKTILITGATSFLGKSVTSHLEKSNQFDLIKTSRTGNKKEQIIRLDLLDYKKTRALLQKTKPDTILHFAALVNLTRDFETARNCIDANIISTLNLLEATKNIGIKKVIFTSTEEVYGNNKTPYKENQNPKPPSMYSISKVAGEHLLHYYSVLHGFSFISLRFGTFFGPGSQPDRFLTQIIRSALTNKSILLNSGQLKRDYIYIDDAVNAIEKAIKTKITENEIINIGGKKAVSLYTFVKKVVKHSQSKSKIVLHAFPDRVGEAPYQKLSISRAKKILKWEPKISLDDGIKKSVDFFSKNNYHDSDENS